MDMGARGGERGREIEGGNKSERMEGGGGGKFLSKEAKIGVDGRREEGENGDDVRDGPPVKTAGRNGRQDNFIPLHFAKLSFPENLRNFRNYKPNVTF